MRAGCTSPASGNAIFPILPAGSLWAGAGGDLLRLEFDRLLDRDALFRLARIAAPADAWKDQVFSRGLPFYLFDLPFYAQVLGFVFVLAILCALVFWATARGWQLAERFATASSTSGPAEHTCLGPNTLLLPGATRAGFVRDH
jgi:hypothetical protein